LLLLLLLSSRLWWRRCLHSTARGLLLLASKGGSFLHHALAAEGVRPRLALSATHSRAKALAEKRSGRNPSHATAAPSCPQNIIRILRTLKYAPRFAGKFLSLPLRRRLLHDTETAAPKNGEGAGLSKGLTDILEVEACSVASL